MRYARPNNAEELKATIRATWALITPEQCHRLIDSMPRRIAAVIQAKGAQTNGAFPLHGTVRHGTVRLSSGRFAFPLQFSTAIEWAGLFTRRYNCAASTAVTSS